jgi:Peptidase family M28
MRPDPQQLRADVAALASIERASASPGERRAAEWIADRLREQGLDPVVESERAHGTYHRPVGALAALGVASGIAALAGRRGLAAIGGALATAGLVDEFDHGPHVLRRAAFPQSEVTNVWAVAGDADSERTVVVYAHHDAAHGGAFFAPDFQAWLATIAPKRIEATDTSLPIHWPMLSAPALVALGALTGRRGLVGAGMALSALGVVMCIDIERYGVVPGANDNLSGVAVVLAVARALRERPVEGVRVVLLSAGSEEAFQQGIRAWGRRHFPALPRNTRFLNFDTIGSPELALLEGEGPIRMRDYDAGIKDEVSAAAADAGVHLRRGLRARPSTDGTTPHRAGFPVATFVSVNWFKGLDNYHQHSDRPEFVDYETVRDAAVVAETVIRRSATAASTRRPA